MHQLKFNINIAQVDLYTCFQRITATIDEVDLNVYIAKFGMDSIVAFATNKIISMLPTYKLGYQFSMEELDFATMASGNSVAIKFIQDSGIEISKYHNATSHSMPEIDRPGGPQQTLHAICLAMNDKHESSVFRTEVAKNIMRHFKIGLF